MRLLRSLLGSYLALICWQGLKLPLQRLSAPLQQEQMLSHQQLTWQQQQQQQVVMVLVHKGSLSQTGPTAAQCC
jgi:hypothetical protein